MRPLRIAPWIPLAAAALSACTPVPLPVDTGETGDGGAEAPTLAGLRQAGLEDGDRVQLGGLVATSARSLDGRVFYLQDPGGGAWSGARVRLVGTFEDLQVQPGQVLAIDGSWDGTDGPEIQVDDEADLSWAEETAEVTATALDPAGLAEDEALSWAAALVQVGPQVLAGCPDAWGQVALDSGLVLDDVLVDYPAGRGATVDALVGVAQPALGQWLLLPRQVEDLQGYDAGEGCAWTVPELWAQARAGKALDAALPGVVAVSGPTLQAPRGFFVQQEGGGADSGVFVRTEAEVEVGAVLDVAGRASLDGGLLVLDAESVTATGESREPVVSGFDAQPADWTGWVGSLLSLPEVQTTGEPDATAQCPLDDGLVLGSWFLPCTAPAGTSWSRVTGVLASSEEGLALQPRSEADLP